ncbi:DNA polymerase subunit gamma-1 [Frankliniella fusca]|uniref:DNA polymerase subunit gamma-1 n=1 Tax=Frankliniella fusca TaxID=407009 RepID=A0AAE1LTG3_9NEOP|nr:DNA polymerase subunit gamma-1 [Frankliniella fusca]
MTCVCSGIDDPDRVIVLCSEESLRVLTWSETIYADGTFKTVPNQFGQLYTIHGVVKDVAGRSYVFPLVFALCVRKDMQTYRKIWDAIKQEAERLNLRFKVRMFMTDFEIAAMNVQQAIFPGVEHKGCLFHFNQALWRQTVDSGLKVLYHNAENEDHTVRRDVQRLMALPFVPIPDLEETFDAVVDDMDDRVVPLATTMDSTYLRGANLRRRRVVPPRFPPALWNVHQQAVDDSARTNNVVEGWHSKFQKLLVVHHANVWKFLDEVIDEEHDFHQLLAQVRAGHINIKQPTNKKYEMCQRRLHNLANNYEEYKERNEVMLYLQAVAYNIKIQD